jgi:hypothetical protein
MKTCSNSTGLEASMSHPTGRRGTARATVCALVLLLLNLAIVAKLFGIEFLAYNGSVEGTFIAIARVMATHPAQWGWWPLWDGGMPVEMTYLPLQQWMVAGFSLMSGIPPARSFHMVAAAVYALGPVTAFWMALELSRRMAASFLAALAYSCISVSALLVPAIRADAGGALALRRLEILVSYGESPHTLALTLLPVAVLCFARALTRGGALWKILAGCVCAAVALSNAFGIVLLAAALLAWLAAFPARPWWKRPAVAAAIGAVGYCWVSPWFSFRLIRAIRASAPTAGGDFRYTTASWIALPVMVGGWVLLWLAMRHIRTPAHLQFFWLLDYFPAALVLFWYGWQVPVLPQANRYQLDLDFALPLALILSIAARLDRAHGTLPRLLRSAVALLVLAGLAIQAASAARNARSLIRAADPLRSGDIKVAKWMDSHLRGQRAFIGGSRSLLYNAITDNPQFQGGHNQEAVNPLIGIAAFTIYTDTNAGTPPYGPGVEYSLLWLKAFGARAIAVSGPESDDYYHPYAHPHKFDGVLPLLWRDGGDAIYQVPSRSASLAHVIPAAAVPSRARIHGLDVEPLKAYVAALDDPALPAADFQWTGMSRAEIQTNVGPGQVVSVQVSHDSGWEAWVNGKRRPVRKDGIGLMVIDPETPGPCTILLQYTGGAESVITRTMSAIALLVALGCAWFASHTPVGAPRAKPESSI